MNFLELAFFCVAVVAVVVRHDGRPAAYIRFSSRSLFCRPPLRYQSGGGPLRTRSPLKKDVRLIEADSGVHGRANDWLYMYMYSQFRAAADSGMSARLPCVGPSHVRPSPSLALIKQLLLHKQP